MHDTLIVIGANGHGKVILDIARKMKKWTTIQFLDDDSKFEDVLGYDVIGKSDDIKKHKNHADFFVAIGNNFIRAKILKKLIENNYSIATLIHPNAVIGMDVKIGVGTVVMARAVINSSTRIGIGCIINTSSVVEHDNIIFDYVHISPGAKIAGTVTVGELSWVGIGSTIINNLDIVNNSIIGAGSVVIEDINSSGTYFGAPARRQD